MTWELVSPPPPLAPHGLEPGSCPQPSFVFSDIDILENRGRLFGRMSLGAGVPGVSPRSRSGYARRAGVLLPGSPQEAHDVRGPSADEVMFNKNMVKEVSFTQWFY